MKPKHPGGRPTSYRPEFCQRVVALMAEGRSLEGCAALLGVHPDSLNEWQKVHPQFSVAVRAGRAAATTLRALAHTRRHLPHRLPRRPGDHADSGAQRSARLSSRSAPLPVTVAGNGRRCLMTARAEGVSWRLRGRTSRPRCESDPRGVGRYGSSTVRSTRSQFSRRTFAMSASPNPRATSSRVTVGASP